MNTKALVIGLVSMLALAAVAGIVQPVKAADTGVTPMDSGDHTGLVFYDSVDGIQICDGPGIASDAATPYGNATVYESGETPFDWAKDPEEYGGYVVDGTNGHASDAGYYIFANFGARMTDYFPALPYYIVTEIGPAAWGGHHPTATRNYTASTVSPNWDEEPEMWPNAMIRPVPQDVTATDVAGAAQITWTDVTDDNNVITGYRIYKSVGGAAWTRLAVVNEGVETYTDGAGSYAAANRYAVGIRYAENLFGYGKSNIAHCGVVVDNPPVANAGVDQTVNEDTVVTFTGAASTDDNGIASYSWTFTDGTPKTLTGVGPTYTFATPGVYTVTLTVTDTIGQTDTDTMTVTVNDNTPIAITDNTPGSVAPLTAFDIVCVGTDFQTLNINSITLFWEDVTGVVTGPVVASTYVSVGDNQITKADNNDNSPMDTHTWTWAIPAQATPGEVQYYFATNDGVTGATTYPAGANLVAGPYETVLIAVQGNQNQPHPLVGRIYDNATGLVLDGAIVTATWYDSTDGAWFTNWTVSGLDGLGVGGWYQIDIFHNNWTAGDLLYVNASFNVGGVDYWGYNTTLFQSGDDFLPDDDKEYINVYIDIIEYFELKWTLGWNIWSIPMIRAENASLGLADLAFSWFANEHWLDTSQVGVGDEATLVAWTGAAYITYIYPIDNATANDITVTPDYGYWAEVGESWFTDEAALALPEIGILVPGQYIWRSMLVRTVTVNVGWNLLGWTSFATGFTGTDVIMTLDTCPADAFGINQPEIVANWTADTWEAGVVADMAHYEGDKGYTTFVSLGAYGQSTPNYDFPVGAGYGYWVYSYTAGTIVYATI